MARSRTHAVLSGDRPVEALRQVGACVGGWRTARGQSPHLWPGLWSHRAGRPHPSAPRSRLLSHPLTAPLSLSSIVLMASRGRYVSRGPWTRVLEKLGADEGIRLKGKGFGQGWMRVSVLPRPERLLPTWLWPLTPQCTVSKAAPAPGLPLACARPRRSSLVVPPSSQQVALYSAKRSAEKWLGPTSLQFWLLGLAGALPLPHTLADVQHLSSPLPFASSHLCLRGH